MGEGAKRQVTATEGPIPWAIRLTKILDVAKPEHRYPVDVSSLALDLSADLYRNEPVVKVHGAEFPDIDGALVRVPDRGWAILFNSRIASPGRTNFTLAHEFGHYLLHRGGIADEMRCNSKAMFAAGSTGKVLEKEANEFAAYLLMPFHDYRVQIGPKERPTIEQLSACASRYGTSLVAAILRWLEFTSVQAILVISRDGFVDWARSSEPAKRARRYFKPSAGPIEIPIASPANHVLAEEGSMGIRHPAGVWFDVGSFELALRSDQYDFCLSLIFLDID